MEGPDSHDAASPGHPGLDRRSALRRLATGGLGGFLLPTALDVPAAVAAEPHSPTSPLSAALGTPIPALPDPGLRARDPESYWEQVRRDQFLLPDDRAFLNPGSLGVMPRVVLRAVCESLLRSAEYPVEAVPRWGYEVLEPERAEVAAFLGCRTEELAFTHNCTEAMSFIAAGLDLKAGDEVLTTNQEHGSGISCWRLREARSGIVVRQVDLPVSPKEPGELLDRLVSAIGPRTRVLSFSGITSPTGLVMPAREICLAARERGVTTVLDGAHMDGQVPVDLRDLGCDFFAASPHKWLFAPAGCGLLFGRDKTLEGLWPTVVSGGWDNVSGLKAARFMMVGTNNRATIDGMIAGIRFLRSLGEEAVYQRQQTLARRLLSEARRRSHLEVVTTDDPRFYRAMVTIRFKSDRLDPLWAELKRQNIITLGGQRLRLSTHIHARNADIARLFATFDRILGA